VNYKPLKIEEDDYDKACEDLKSLDIFKPSRVTHRIFFASPILHYKIHFIQEHGRQIGHLCSFDKFKKCEWCDYYQQSQNTQDRAFNKFVSLINVADYGGLSIFHFGKFAMEQINRYKIEQYFSISTPEEVRTAAIHVLPSCKFLKDSQAKRFEKRASKLIDAIRIKYKIPSDKQLKFELEKQEVKLKTIPWQEVPPPF